MNENRFRWRPLSAAPRENTVPCELIYRSGEFAFHVRNDAVRLPEELVGCEVAALMMDPDDVLYAACRVKGHEIARFAPDGSFLDFVKLDEEIGRVHGMFLNRAHELWITDDGFHVARKFDQAGRCIQTLGTPHVPSDTGVDPASLNTYLAYLTIRRAGAPFNKPTKLIETPDGKLFASDGYGNAAVHAFAPDGTLLRTWGGPGQEPGHFNIPHSIFHDACGRLWVSDRDNDRVQAFSESGELLTILDGLLYPGELWSDGVNLYVSEMDGRISIFDMDGVLIAEIGHRKTSFSGHSMTGDSHGNLYIGNFGEYPIVKFERLREKC